MPIFFFVGGFSNYVTYTAMRERGETGGAFVRSRAARLLRPSLVFFARVGRGPGHAAPHRHRSAGRSHAVGRDDAASRRPAARSHGAVRSAVVLGGLSGGGGAGAVDDRAPPAVRLVGARRHGAGRGGLRRDRVRLRAAVGSVGQRGVRPAAAAPAGALLRRRFDAPVAPGGVLVDARGGPGRSRGVDHARRVPLGGRCALRLVPRDRALPQEPVGHRRRTGLERLPTHGVLPAGWDLVDRGRDAPAAGAGAMAAANPRLGRDDRGQQRDHDAVPVAHDRVPAGRAVAVAARVRPRARQHPEVVAGTPVVDRRACPDPRGVGGDLRPVRTSSAAPDAIAPEPGNAQARRGVGPRRVPPIGAARGGTFNHRATPPPRHRIRDPGRDRFGHRVRRVCDLRRHAGLALPAGVAAGRAAHRVRSPGSRSSSGSTR